MATIRVEPAGIEFEIPGTEPILFEAQAAGYAWPTVCGGKGTCHTCFLRVITGADALSPIAASETESIEALGLTTIAGEPRRLACQAVARGDVVVHRPGVRSEK